MDLVLAPPLARVVLVQPREIAIVALVQREIFARGKAGLAELGEDQIERVLRARQHRGEREVERQPFRLQLTSGFLRLGNALFGEIRILPACEQVLQIPFALAVAQQHKKTFVHYYFPLRDGIEVLRHSWRKTPHIGRGELRTRRSDQFNEKSPCVRSIVQMSDRPSTSVMV